MFPSQSPTNPRIELQFCFYFYDAHLTRATKLVVNAIAMNNRPDFDCECPRRGISSLCHHHNSIANLFTLRMPLASSYRPQKKKEEKNNQNGKTIKRKLQQWERMMCLMEYPVGIF